ncbi:hypothetical protein CVU37_00445 [candidate division BRC1 bacterium HGW-BRC1-1]|jgi:hypothetical protein|nr:MAG: hypothetical protein CVU37_00445 [candidate division BRC1 bacterium HGW-BRC1-1]
MTRNTLRTCVAIAAAALVLAACTSFKALRLEVEAAAEESPAPAAATIGLDGPTTAAVTADTDSTVSDQLE